MLAPAAIEQALATEERSVVTPDELTVLSSRRRRRSALRAARTRWGRKVARELRRVQKEQLKLARMIADGVGDLAGQRSHILMVRRTYDASVEAIQAADQIRGPYAVPSSGDWRARAAKARRDEVGKRGGTNPFP